MNKMDEIKEKLKTASGEEKAILLNDLANEFNKTDPEKCEQLALEALAFAIKIDLKEEIGRSNHIIGMSFHRRGEYDKALTAYNKALKIFEDLENKLRIAGSQNNIGAIYELRADFSLALKYYFEALKIWEELNETQRISVVYNNIGIVYEKLSNYDLALEYHFKSMKMKEKMDNPAQLAISYSNIGNVYNDKDNPDEALKYHLKSLEIKEKIGEKRTIGISYSNIGTDYERTGDNDKAIEYYMKSLNIFEDISDKYGIIFSTQTLGRIYTEIQSYDLAKKYLQKSLLLAREIGTKELEMNTNKLLAHLYETQSDFEQALKYYLKYTDLQQEIFNERKSKQIAEMRIKYETETKEKETEIYRLKNVELQKQIVKRKKAEEQLQLSKERLRMLNKIIRHDLANDFIVIQSAVHLFRYESQPEMLDEIEKRVEQSLKTIDNFRKYESRLDSNALLDEVDVAKLINELIIGFPKIEINVAGSSIVFADHALSSVFTNLISNAIIHGEATKIDIIISSKDNFCEIRFKDNGNGIPDEIKDKIFEEGFFHGKKGHTGIGLHIVKQTIEDYGGFIYIEDNHPKGVIFVISLGKVIK
ncbi:MAG: tetratricopeptide repeat-containing sensor histidine kinase [Candidatus Cloacimonadota bacterium]|nr:tetratricopeptide repeat-containing sensor histidine kinase [Candidatus Cloacimonadota bacterium]